MTDPGAAVPEGGGTYTLLIDLDVDRPTAVRFGAAGERDLAAGRYAYTGSALGAGGFARIDRHRRVAAGEVQGNTLLARFRASRRNGPGSSRLK